MVKIVQDILIKITITLGSIVGLAIVVAGIVYLFIGPKPEYACLTMLIGCGTIIGRSALEKGMESVAVIGNRPLAKMHSEAPRMPQVEFSDHQGS